MISILYKRPLESGTCILSMIRQGMAMFTRSDESPDAPCLVIYPIRNAINPTPIRVKRVQILVATGRKSILSTLISGYSFQDMGVYQSFFEDDDEREKKILYPLF